MISFLWNDVNFDITDVGGGTLRGEIPFHSHAKNSYELHFITGGSGALLTQDGEYRLKRGDFFITGPKVYHSQISDAHSPMSDVFLTLQASESKRINAVCAAFLSQSFCFFEGVDFAAAQQLLSEYRGELPDYKTAVSGLCMQILTQITRLLLPPDFEDSDDGKTLNDRRFVIIEQAFLYEKNITLSQLADKIGLCERQTQRLLKNCYGKTFREKKREMQSAPKKL